MSWPGTARSASPTDVRVLIVDDEPDILLMMRLSLEAQGFETALAADGERAVERLSTEDFDVVLLDVMMPVLDGWGVLEHVRQSPRQSPPIIVVSAKTADRDVARALRLGAAEYLTKPFDLSALSDVIHRVVGLTLEEREARREAKLAELSDG